MVTAFVLTTAGVDFRAAQQVPTSPGSGLTEIYRHGGDTVGDDPFIPRPPAGTAAVAMPNTAPGGPTSGRSFQGREPGLYGGVPNEPVGGRAATIAHFDADRTAAEAAVEALNSDDRLRWRDGERLSVDTLGTYLAELTPVVLRVDVRVTYHLLRTGRAVSQQAVLEAGTVVLVDVFGVPRLRGISGTPLTRPQVVADRQVSFTGDEWAGFDPGRVFEVRPADEALTVLVLFDFITDSTFQRPCGTTGDRDVVGSGPEPSVLPNSTITSAAPIPPPTAEPSREVDVSGVWILASEHSGVEGTLTREGDGFRYYTPDTSDHIGWNCYLGGLPGQTATMDCTSSVGGDSYPWSATGPITEIQWNGRTKLRFDGTTTSPPTGATRMTLTPQ
ncbi:MULTISPECIES: DUF6777 domain-containing protein [unclassified Nocardia]|uniref:DUF6777 domain-containing protein n=1 Tax=unclassified Nocardia TaxID=2637762 RepID=UPI0024A8D98F|nr:MULTISPECIES: DUF6777 domain-containing protein [unclassified Nocardia]